LGAVYLVVDIKVTERTLVAREYLPLPVSEEERMKAEEAFQATVDQVRTFTHPSLVQVFDSFVEGNRTYLITEYVDGFSLEALANLTPNPLPENQVLEWAIQVCDPLEYLHTLPQPFYKKDLSPRTIIADRDGHVKLGGYGLHLIFTPPKEIPHTFLAPEFRETGVPSMEADIYSFGATLYFLLTRNNPEPLQSIHSINPSVSEKTSQAIMPCIDPDPKKRPKNVIELQRKFNEILHPPEELRVPGPKRYVPPLHIRMREAILKSIAAVVTFTVEAIHRPYYFFLLALISGAIYLTVYHSKSPTDFQKNGPTLYVVTSQGISAVDPMDFRLLHRIPELTKALSAFVSLDNQSLWVASRDGYILSFNTQNDQLLNRFSMNQAIGGMALGQPGFFYVSLDRDNLVSANSTSTGTTITVTPVGREPGDVVYNSAQNELYVLNPSQKSMSVINASTYLVTQTITFDSKPSHMVGNTDGTRLCFAFDDLQEVDVYDSATRTRATSLTLSPPGPYALFLSDKGLVVSAHGGNEILLYEPLSWNKKIEVPLDKPERAILGSTGDTIYVANDAGYLFGISTCGVEITK